MKVTINIIGMDNIVRESYTTDAYLLIVQANGEVQLRGSAGNLMGLVGLLGAVVGKFKSPQSK